MKEKDFSILFRHWLRANPQPTASYEIKDSGNKDYLSFRAVTQPQIDYGLAINSDKGVLIRTPAISEGTPDYVYLRNCPSYVVIRYKICFCIISVKAFFDEKMETTARSLTVDRARTIADIVVDL